MLHRYRGLPGNDCTIMGRVLALITVVATGLGGGWAWSEEPDRAIAESFPRFVVPGREQPMRLLRELFWLHRGPRTMTTLWDPWIPMSVLWPAAPPDGTAARMRAYIRQSLLSRKIDQEGYVATQQHRGLAHADGWPFPTWAQAGGVGWHFTLAGDGYARMLKTPQTTSLDGWKLDGLEFERIDPEQGLILKTAAAVCRLDVPSFRVPAIVAPFMRLEWSIEGEAGKTTARLYWTDASSREAFTPELSADIDLSECLDNTAYSMVPLYRHPAYGPDLTGLRLEIQGKPGSRVVIRSLITAIDTRHPINNSVYLQACSEYFSWTTDLDFLRANMLRMRKALGYALSEFQVRERKLVSVPWTGHDGRSGLTRGADGSKQIHRGQGVGNNYWDLLPFGGEDALATIYLFDALMRMSRLEKAVSQHREWEIPPPEAASGSSSEELLTLAQEIKKSAGQRFWNRETGRFFGWIDADGIGRDYGFSTLNCESIYYHFATDEQARSILSWLDGQRLVQGDTSRGDDIYLWRFAPRATTRRNVETYAWVWSNPEKITWGNQVQDGGAVLGWSYFDLMARLEVLGADNAWNRLKAILSWFEQVSEEGGYRAYYAKPGRGKLQGGGTPGGLGLDHEFFESVLVPQVMLYGFLGLHPIPGGFTLNPRLPADWPSLKVTGIHVQDVVLEITASGSEVRMRRTGGQADQTLLLGLPAGSWNLEHLADDAQVMRSEEATWGEPGRGSTKAVRFDSPALRFEKH